jgi:Ricin-type beta-trefoil lectin domain-like
MEVKNVMTPITDNGDTFKIISDLSGKVLDVWQENTEDRAQIAQYDYHGGKNQLIRCFLLG